MKRQHLFELEDMAWLPSSIRNCLTDFLQFVFIHFKIYRPATSLIKEIVKEIGTKDVVDLCSGGSGPILEIQKQLKEKHALALKVILTDKFPNLPKFEQLKRERRAAITFVPHSIDARDVPQELKGIRTLFTSLHHFKPEDAKRILGDAAAKRVPLLVFEPFERSLFSLFLTISLPFAAWLFTPFIRPFQWRRLFWTYLFPVVPFVILWDGIISVLRMYTPKELITLAESLGSRRYRWRAGKIRSFMMTNVVYLIGIPIRE